MKELFDKLEKLREEFEAIERPNLEMEIPVEEAESSSHEKQQESVSHPTSQSAKDTVAVDIPVADAPAVKSEQQLDTEAELAKLESEFGKVNRDYSGEEIGDWEFDELEKEFRSGDSAAKK